MTRGVLASTLSHSEHLQFKQNKDMTMSKITDLAARVARLKIADYDKEVLSDKDLIKAAVPVDQERLELSRAHNLDLTVIASEMVYVQEEREAIKAESVGFRVQDDRELRIAELNDYLDALGAEFKRKLNNAVRLEQAAQRQAEHDKNIEVITPALEEAASLREMITKDSIKKAVMSLAADSLPRNSLDVKSWELLKSIARGQA